jgi:hypothetical protein
MLRQYNRSSGLKTTSQFVLTPLNVSSLRLVRTHPIAKNTTGYCVVDYGFFLAAATRGRHCQ